MKMAAIGFVRNCSDSADRGPHSREYHDALDKTMYRPAYVYLPEPPS